MFVVGVICNSIVGFMAARIPMIVIISASLVNSIRLLILILPSNGNSGHRRRVYSLCPHQSQSHVLGIWFSRDSSFRLWSRFCVHGRNFIQCQDIVTSWTKSGCGLVSDDGPGMYFCLVAYVCDLCFIQPIQLGTSAGVTISTVVFNRVTLSLREGEDVIRGYRAAQWTCCAFAIFAALLSLLVFRGVGVPGHRKDQSSHLDGASAAQNEQSHDEKAVTEV